MTLWIVLLATLTSLAQTTQPGAKPIYETVIRARPETRPRPLSAPHRSETVPLDVGSGASPIDPPVNSLGLPLRNLERESLLDPYPTQARLRIEPSREQPFRFLTARGFRKNPEWLVGAEYLLDSQSLLSGFFRADPKGNSAWVEWDEPDHEIQLGQSLKKNWNGTIDLGSLSQHFIGLSKRFIWSDWRVTPGLWMDQRERIPLASQDYLGSTTQSIRGHTKLETPEFLPNTLPGLRSSLSLELDQRLRNQSQVTTPYRRFLLESGVRWTDFEWGPTFWNSHFLVSPAFELGKTRWIWDQGTDALVRFHSDYPWGWVARFRRYGFHPKSSHLFGDGGNLISNEDLFAETGIRGQTGLTWKLSDLEGEIAPFFDETKNAPLLIGTSPFAAKAFSIGGVWSRGIDISNKLHGSSGHLLTRYTFQDVVNASPITWQQGQLVPGRPRHVFFQEVEMRSDPVTTGIRYRYQSKNALDLAGLWFESPTHRLDAFIASTHANWSIEVQWNRWFIFKKPSQNSNFGDTWEGKSSPDLLDEPEFEREIRLILEIAL